MNLRGLSTKLFLGVAAAAVVMWVAGVSGQTILSLAAFGLMVAMHAGGHGGHGARSGRAGSSAHADGASPTSSPGAPVSDPATGARPRAGSGGCH